MSNLNNLSLQQPYVSLKLLSDSFHSLMTTRICSEAFSLLAELLALGSAQTLTANTAATSL